MSFQNLLNEFLGTNNLSSESTTFSHQSTINRKGSMLSKVTNNIPGGLMGGLAAGGVVSLLLGSKKARKFAKTTAVFGGAALLGGLAYKTLKDWKQNSNASANSVRQESLIAIENMPSFQLTLIKAMIAAAKADGHIDATEQHRIFKAIAEMNLPAETKGIIFDLLCQPISVVDVAKGANNLEQKSEVYLVSCLAIDNDELVEKIYLAQLANALQLPEDLAEALERQAADAELDVA